MNPPLIQIQGRELRFPRWPRFDAWRREHRSILFLTLCLHLGALVLLWLLLPKP